MKNKTVKDRQRQPHVMSWCLIYLGSCVRLTGLTMEQALDLG